MKILKWIGVIFGALVLIFALYMFQPWVLLPHKHIEISLPFAPEDDASTGLIPYGEKIEHNASNGTPDGHPGIDFGWDRETKILSSSEGRVTNINKDSGGKYNIEIRSGAYKIVYKEMNKIEPDIQRFVSVKKGQLLGYSGYHRTNFDGKPKESDPSGQIHWEFSGASMFIDRLCPVNYFDADSRKRIDAIWAAVPANNQFKAAYPEICNGIFKDKED